MIIYFLTCNAVIIANGWHRFLRRPDNTIRIIIILDVCIDSWNGASEGIIIDVVKQVGRRLKVHFALQRHSPMLWCYINLLRRSTVP